MTELKELAWIPVLIGLFAFICFTAIMLKRGIVWIFHRMTGEDVRRQQLREAEKRRFRTPDWQFFQNHLGRPIDPALVQMYSAHDISEWSEVQLKDREVRLCAIDSESISDGAAEIFGHEVVPLAFDDCGQVVYLKPGESASDAVYIYDADEERVLFESIKEYVDLVLANH